MNWFTLSGRSAALNLVLPSPAAEVVVDEVPAVPSYISDRYKVGRMLGDGNFAVVRECVEHSTGREYALKIINKGKCRGKVNYERGMARAVQECSSRHTVACCVEKQDTCVENCSGIWKKTKNTNLFFRNKFTLTLIASQPHADRRPGEVS